MRQIERSSSASPTAFAHQLGVQLHAGQVAWLETRSRVKVACCGRRWGKSYAEAVDLLWFAAIHRGSAQFLIAPTFDQVTTIFDYAVGLITASPLFAPFVDRIVRSPFPELRVFGSVIHARSAGDEGKNIRSKGADRVLYDEAAFIGEAARAAINPLLANSAIAEQVYISSPWGWNYFRDLFLKGQRGDPGYASFHFPSWTSPYVSGDFLAEQRRDLTSLAFRVEYGAEFVEDQNAVFPYGLIESCIVPPESTEPLPGHVYVLGWDPAKWVDRSGVVVLDVTALPWRVVRCVDISGRDLINQQWPHVRAMARAFNDAAVLLDATHDESLLEFARRDLGSSVEGFAFTNPSKQELINGLVVAMEQGKLTFARDPALIDELLYYRYELTAAGNVRLGADERHHDDLVTALALAVQKAATRKTFGVAAARSERPRPVVGFPSPLSDLRG